MGFDDEGLAFEAPVPDAMVMAFYWRAGADV